MTEAPRRAADFEPDDAEPEHADPTTGPSVAPDELGDLTAAGARAVSVSDGVLRTSTAGTVALAGMLLRP